MDFCDKENLIEFYQPVEKNDIYAKNNSIKVVTVTETGATGEMLITSQLTNENLDVHGGALFSLADTVAGAAAHVWGVRHWGEHTGYTTATASFSYLRPARNGACSGKKLICTATLRKTGRNLAVTDTTIQDEDGVEICTGRFTGCYLDLTRYQKK